MAERIRLDDRQCAIFLRDMREFGYTKLEFDQVRKLADRYADGEDIGGTNAVGGFLQKQLQEAEEALAARRR